ncbi:pentapeptide repeat-containing protein [Anabaena sp. CA = ATCC 33047]|nr:pentapeptide repeat-containing protein [Anabaena sp. CA = ATCC 33047]
MAESSDIYLKTIETTEIIKGKIVTTSTTTKYEPAKTLWDWMGILIAPFVLAIIGLIFQIIQENIQQEKEEYAQKQIEEKQRESAVINYQQYIVNSILNLNQAIDNDQENNYSTEHYSNILDLIRNMTLSILQDLDGDERRKATILVVLYNCSLIKKDKPKVYLKEANFEGANFSKLNLSEADLQGVNFSNANFTNALLSNTNLKEANLSNANLQGANLFNANLSGANLFNADLRKAEFKKADLKGANLSEADLRGAKLSEIILELETEQKELQKQIELAKGDNETTLPNKIEKPKHWR